MELLQRQVGLGMPGAGLLLNSCRALEGKFIDALEETLSRDHACTAAARHECLDWLDKCYFDVFQIHMKI